MQSAAVYRTLGQFGLTVDNIHIHIDHPPAAAFDTVIAVPAGADSLVLDLPVILNAPTEQLLVQIELRSGSEVLFSGTQTVTATVGGTSSGPPPSIPIVYVGPGAGATHLAIAPRDTAIRISGTVLYRYSATDDHNAPVSGMTVAWSTSDATLGSIDGNGAFTPSGKQGVTRIVAATPNGLRDSTTLTITAPPTRLVVVSGAGQTGTVGSVLAQPLVVQAQTADGTAVPGVAVSFSAPATGTVSPTSALTDSAGRAQTTMTLGTTAGAQSFGAVAGGLTGATAAESATAAAAATLAKVSGDAQVDSVGHALPHPFVVRITDAYGNPVAGATVDWTRVAGAGTLAAASSTSDSAGLASVGYTLGTVVRVDTVSAAIHGVPASAVLFTAAGEATTAAAIAVVSGDAQSGTVATGLANPLVVQVTDAHGNAVTGAHVTWAVTTGSGTLTPPLGVTDSTGKAQTSFTFGTTVGTYVVTASVGTSISTTFHETAAAGAAAVMTKTTGDTQTVAASSAVPVKPTVKITDAYKNPIAGLAVTFAVASGGGSVTGASVTTNAAGVASVGGWTVGATGAQSLHVTSGSLSATFTATLIGTTSRVASVLMTPHLDTLTSLGDTYTLAAQARDTSNAVVADTFTWVSRVPATATVSNAGLVTAVANGSTWVVASDASGKQDSAQIVVQQRVATVNITPAARNIYLTRTYTLTAAAVDGRGHPMTGTPTFTWSTNAPAVATVSSAGLVTGVGLGGAQISATTGSITGVATIAVLTPITRIVVGRDSSALPVTDTTSLTSLTATRTFTAVAHDTLDAPMTGVTFTWTSTNGSVAVLDSITATTARATAAANGLTAITAVAQGITGNATLKVSQVLASIQLTPAADTIAVTGSAALVARGLDARGKFISGGTFTYTSGSPGVATVNASTGVVTGVTNGTAFITAASGAIVSNNAAVVVGGSVPAAISFGRDTLSVGRGSSASIPIYLSKPNAAPVTVHLTVGDTTAFWSSANVVIPAGQTAINATLNGHNAGTTIVTAVDSSGTGYSSATAVLAVQASMKLTSTYYAINTTDQVNTQVLLSDPSPAGGTYVTFNYGTAGVAAVSPSPAFIPAGQLAADIQITAVDSGTTTITPTAIGVNGTASNFTAYGAWLHFSTTSIRLGAGQYEPGVYLYTPTYNNLPVAVTLASSDSTIAAVPHTVTIPGGSYYAYFTTTALAAGTATITASAPGWTTTNSLTVLNTAPHVGICCGYGLVTTSPAVTVAVYSEDSLKTAHNRINSLVVRLHSTDTTVMKVLDSVVTIGPGTYYGSARVIPGGLGGSAYIVASASGHTSDSTQYTVTGPKLSLSWTANHIGLGQQDMNLYVSTPNAVTSPLVVNLFGADTNIVGVPATVTIPQGSYYAYFNVRGKALGTMSIIASAGGYQSDTGTYVVTTPRIALSGGGTLNNFGPAQGFTVYSEDSVGTVHYR
ncbi:MAG: beta strand repeat-containing protein, partial [Gemmatimonadaceae bacterium]